MKFQGRLAMGHNWLHFGGDPDHRLDTGIVFRIRSLLSGDTENG